MPSQLVPLTAPPSLRVMHLSQRVARRLALCEAQNHKSRLAPALGLENPAAAANGFHISHPPPYSYSSVRIVFCIRSSQGERENCLSRKGEEGARRPQIL